MFDRHSTPAHALMREQGCRCVPSPTYSQARMPSNASCLCERLLPTLSTRPTSSRVALCTSSSTITRSCFLNKSHSTNPQVSSALGFLVSDTPVELLGQVTQIALEGPNSWTPVAGDKLEGADLKELADKVCEGCGSCWIAMGLLRDTCRSGGSLAHGTLSVGSVGMLAQHHTRAPVRVPSHMAPCFRSLVGYLTWKC